MTRTETITKIKKLLSLANGTNFEGESVAAMTMLRALLAKNNLSMSDVDDANEPEENVTKTGFKSGGNWRTLLAVIIAKYCNCRVLKSRPTNIFLGMPFEVEVCSSTFNMVADQMDKMMTKERGRLRKIRTAEGRCRQNSYESKNFTRGYSMGIIQTLEDRLKDQIKEEVSKAIVIVEHPKVAEYVRTQCGGPARMPGGRGGSSEAYRKGQADGNSVRLHKGINKARSKSSTKMIGN